MQRRRAAVLLQRGERGGDRVRGGVEDEELCERESLVDFGELLLRVYMLLKSNEGVLKHYQKRFSNIHQNL